MDFVELALWSAILLGSLFVLVRGAHMFLLGSHHVGKVLRMSSFATGVLIVGVGTSLPELSSSIAAALVGATEIVPANVIGSNITNILLIVGMLAAFGGHMIISKDLIRTELPIFFIATAHFVAVIFDGEVDRLEALLLLGTFCAYLWYLFVESQAAQKARTTKRPKIQIRFIVYTLLGLFGILAGSYFTIQMVTNIATTLAVPIGLITIVVLSIGTSLPELFVSIQALKMKEPEMAVGNIFGSNAFNVLVVIGIPALIHPLVADDITLRVALPIFVAASAIFFVNGLSRQIMRWEGLMMLLFFAFFLLKVAFFV